MTDKQRLAKLLTAESELKKTTRGYTPTGVHWRKGMPLLWEVRTDLGNTADGQSLAVAHGLLKQTEHGYDPFAFRWREAMERIDRVQANLQPPPIPALGPIVAQEKPTLLWAPTHDTDGFPEVWPAYDLAFGREGASVIAPEPCRVVSHHGSDGGVGFRVKGESGIIHLILHATSRPAVGRTFTKGQKMSALARLDDSQGGTHCHHALDTRPLTGEWLKYGRNGNGPDYTFGSPTIGQQLAKALVA
jgi:hypothetical protein